MQMTIDVGPKIMPKTLINVGALFDIPTASFITGKYGETIINGGLPQIVGIVGRGNTFKSTIMRYLLLSAANKISKSTSTAITSYDTEMNISMDRLQDMANRFDNLPEDLFYGDHPMWTITDKSMLPGNDWAVAIEKYMQSKSEDKNLIQTYEAFKNPYNKEVLKLHTPTFVELDSLTEFEAESTVDMLTKDLDSSDVNMSAMKQGLFKTRFLSQLPRLASMSNTYIFVTAHVGEKKDMASSPYAPKPAKDLQFMKGDDKIKGTGGKFYFLTTHAWATNTPSVLKNQGTKGPEYPLTSEDSTEPDLNVITITMLRSKTGQSGISIPLVISQTEGVLPSLSEFHYIKENDRFGLEGNAVNYSLAILPDVKLSRTTVRSKINSDPKLRRALNITAELLQLHVYHRERFEKDGLLCTPKELYDDLIKLGYDWNILLETRGYWLIDQYKNEVPFLSTVDLLKMRKGLYTPYWLNKKEEDKKDKK